LIPLFKVFVSEDVEKSLIEVLRSGYIGQGPKVDEFEQILSNYLGNPYVNTVNSCTSGLHLALRLLNLQPGDEVLTTPLTCTATNVPILANGLKIKWVDVDPNTCNMDMLDLARKLTPKTKAIMLVHWGGYPVDLDEVRRIANYHKLLHGFYPQVIEDCAHAWGAIYKGKLLGNHGNICVFSFQAIKHFTTGDGGIIVCPSDGWHRRSKLMRWYGLDRSGNTDFRCEQDIDEWGYKFHMNDINATIGIHNFPHIEGLLKIHVDNGLYYDERLRDVDGVTTLECLTDRQSSYWIYTILVEDRDGFMRKMKNAGIATSRVHDRNDKHPCFKESKTLLPNLDEVCKKMVCIPCGWWVTNENREYIFETIKKGW